MPGVALSSLRVTTDMDSSGYTQGMAAKVAADQAGIQSADSLGQALARTDAALDKVTPGAARLSKGLLDGYSAASTFERTIRSIGDAVDRGLGLDRANVLLDAAYRKFGLVADAAVLAKQGFVSLTPSIDSLNQHYSIQAEIIDRATQATQRQTQAMAAQAEYNARLGVSDYKPGAAQSSADAFMAPFGGLEGVAKAKAEQIGKSFQQSLTQSFGIDAPTKSAREAAATFQEQFDQLDTLTEMRAKQMGENFQKSLNESFGIGAPKATSQGATYSALDEMMKQQEAIQKARAEQNAQGAQQGVNDSFGIGAQAKSAKDSASVFDEALKKEEALDAAAQKLQASLNPLAAAQKLYNDSLVTYQKLADTGRISTTDLASANDMAAKQLSATTKETTNFSGAAAFGGTQFMAFSAAIRHMFDAVQAGRPVTQAFMMELGNLQYGLSGSNGLGGSLQNIAKYALSFITPLTTTIGVVGGFGVAATVAAVKWDNAQLDITRSLTGVGRAAGASVSDINKIAEAHSSVSTISISEARNVAEALAQTGKVTKDEFGPIIDITKNLAATLGVNMTEATKQLAAAFADPAKGADDLNKKLGFLNSANMALVQSLSAQGDKQGANRVILDALNSSLGKATELTHGWAQAWNVVANYASNAFTKLGEGVSKFVSGGGGSSQTVEQLQAKLASLQQANSNYGPGATGTALRTQTANAQQITQVTAALDAMLKKQQEISAAAKQQDTNQFSKEITALADAAVPADAQIKELTNAMIALNKAAADPSMAKATENYANVALAASRFAEAAKSTIDPVQKMTDQLNLQLKAVDNRAPSDRAAIASQQKLLELSGQKVTAEEKASLAQKAGAIASGGQTAQDQQIVTRIGLLGTLATVQDKVNAKRLELTNANRDLDPGNKLSASDIAAITHITQVQEEQALLQERVSVGVAKEAEIRKKMADDSAAYISRQRTIPLTQEDRNSFLDVQEKKIEKLIDQSNVASSKLEGLKKLEIDSGGSAGGFRNLVDSTSVSSLNSVASGLADITTGSKTAKAGFADMGATIVRALEEMLIKITIILPLAKALQLALGGFFGGGAGGGGGGGGGIPLPGLTGGFHSGGTTSEPTFLRFVAPGTFDLAPRFHSGIGPGELPAILRRDESVLTPKQMAQLAPAYAAPAGGSGGTQVNITNHSGGDVKTRRRQSGNKNVIDVVVGAVGDKMAGGTFDAPMQARYGSKIKPITR